MSSEMAYKKEARERVSDDFGAAAGDYDAVARLQQAVGARLMQRLRADAGSYGMDLGCGTGYFLPMLAECFEPGMLLAADLSPGMINYARSRRGIATDWVVADAHKLPLADASLDWVFSSLMVQWCGDIPAVAREVARILKPGGEAVLSTLVAGTLCELEYAWTEADSGGRHVNRFLSRYELEESLATVFPGLSIGFESRVLWYTDVMDLLKELKTLGARYKDDSRHRGAMAPTRLRALDTAYERFRQPGRGVPATWQVAYVRLPKPAGWKD